MSPDHTNCLAQTEFMNWNKYKKEFEWDGSLRDLYILNTDISHWQRLIDSLQGGTYKITFKVDDETVAMPEDVTEIFRKRDEVTVLMSLALGGIIINSHFFTDQQIEFDIDPREINSEEKLNQLFGFMRGIGQLLQKEVLLTSENAQEIIIFRYMPDTERVEHNPFGGC